MVRPRRAYTCRTFFYALGIYVYSFVSRREKERARTMGYHFNFFFIFFRLYALLFVLCIIVHFHRIFSPSYLSSPSSSFYIFCFLFWFDLPELQRTWSVTLVGRTWKYRSICFIRYTFYLYFNILALRQVLQKKCIWRLRNYTSNPRLIILNETRRKQADKFDRTITEDPYTYTRV